MRKPQKLMKHWIAPVIGMVLFSSPATAGPNALQLGYCASDFDVCYNNCRISHPEMTFSADRARVICGLNCLKQRQQCEARAGGIVRSVPKPIAPLPPQQQQVPQQARPAAPSPAQQAYPQQNEQRRVYPRQDYSRPSTVRQAPAGVAGPAPVQHQTTPAPQQTTSSTQRPVKTEEKESGFLGWFKRPEKKKPMIPGKR